MTSDDGRGTLPPLPSRRDAIGGLLGSTLLIAGCTRSDPVTRPATPSATRTEPPAPPRPALGAAGANTGHRLATDAAMAVLRRGGNAVDAAIAAAFADAVMQPASSGIGGGGVSIVVRGDERKNHDYREVVARSGKVPASGVGTPGFVAGMADLHERYGTQPWADLLEPAIAIAQDGGPVSRYFAQTLATARGRRVVRGLDHFHRRDGSVLRRGDTLVQKDLAATMRLLAADGPSALYDGALTSRLTRVPGLDAAALKAYRIQHSVRPKGSSVRTHSCPVPWRCPGERSSRWPRSLRRWASATWTVTHPSSSTCSPEAGRWPSVQSTGGSVTPTSSRCRWTGSRTGPATPPWLSH